MMSSWLTRIYVGRETRPRSLLLQSPKTAVFWLILSDKVVLTTRRWRFSTFNVIFFSPIFCQKVFVQVLLLRLMAQGFITHIARFLMPAPTTVLFSGIGLAPIARKIRKFSLQGKNPTYSLEFSVQLRLGCWLLLYSIQEKAVLHRFTCNTCKQIQPIINS